MQGVCSTCLSSDRIVKQLNSFPVKNTLWEWFDIGGSGNFNVNVDEFKLCWECKAMFAKINLFKKQVFKAQKIRLKVAQKKTPRLIKLSKLKTYYKNTYDMTYKYTEDPNDSFTTREIPETDTSSDDLNVANNKKTRSENGKHKIAPVHSHTHKHKEKQKNSHDSKRKHKKHDNNNEESFKKKKDNAASNDIKFNVKKKYKSKTTNDKHLSIEPPIDKEKHNDRKSLNDSKIKVKRKRHEDDEEECYRKRIKLEREADTANVGPNIGTNKDNTEESNIASDLKLELPEVKFTIVHLNEEQMLKNREKDRNAQLFKGREFKCESCIIGFAYKTQYEKHNREKHSELVGKLICPICNIRFVRKGFLKLHQDNHYRSYKCRQCDFEHHRRYAIDSHVVKEHDLKPSPVCLACDIEFDSKILLINHYETVHEEVLQCDIVETFNNDVTVKEEGDEDSNTESVDTMKCSLCNRTFDGMSSFRAHMQFAHSDLAEYAYCTDCDLQFSSVLRYRTHLNESQKHRHVQESIFNCAYCISKFSNKEYLLAHIVRAHRLLSHTCAMCNKGFSDPDRLKNHIELKHPDVVESPKDKICPICSKAFDTRSSLLHHLRTHTAEKPFQCEQCEKRFAVKAILNKHVQRTHQDDNNN